MKVYKHFGTLVRRMKSASTTICDRREQSEINDSSTYRRRSMFRHTSTKIVEPLPNPVAQRALRDAAAQQCVEVAVMRFLALETRNSKPKTRNPTFGTWHLKLDLRRLTFGTWNLEPETILDTRSPEGRMKLVINIPCFNEDKTLPLVLKGCRNNGV